MKKLALVIVLMALAGCSSAPRKLLMKNCEAAGSGLYYCEEIEKREMGGHNK